VLAKSVCAFTVNYETTGDVWVVGDFFIRNRNCPPFPPSVCPASGPVFVVYALRIDDLVRGTGLNRMGNMGVEKIPVGRFYLAGGCPWWCLTVVNLPSPAFPYHFFERIAQGLARLLTHQFPAISVHLPREHFVFRSAHVVIRLEWRPL
jgi:hypothetical protein